MAAKTEERAFDQDSPNSPARQFANLISIHFVPPLQTLSAMTFYYITSSHLAVFAGFRKTGKIEYIPKRYRLK